MDRQKAIDLSNELANLTEEERAALEHVAERKREDGDHSLTGCPRYSRAMCRHRVILTRLRERGIEF